MCVTRLVSSDGPTVHQFIKDGTSMTMPRGNPPGVQLTDLHLISTFHKQNQT